MEDLIPLLIFVVIVIVNVLKAATENKGKKRPPGAQPKPQPPRRQPSTLEEFFEEIAQKFEPQPREMPEWPESIKRPDYRKEMEAYERTQAGPLEEEPVEHIPPPPPKPAVAAHAPPKAEAPRLQTQGKTAMFKLPIQGAVFSGTGSMRISTPVLLRSATGHIDFELKNKEQFKQALIASMVFGPPRAYDTSFDNTIAK